MLFLIYRFGDFGMHSLYYYAVLYIVIMRWNYLFGSVPERLSVRRIFRFGRANFLRAATRKPETGSRWHSTIPASVFSLVIGTYVHYTPYYVLYGKVLDFRFSKKNGGGRLILMDVLWADRKSITITPSLPFHHHTNHSRVFVFSKRIRVHDLLSYYHHDET